MHTTISGQFAMSATSRALRDLVLDSIGASHPRSLSGNTGLPAGAIDLLDFNMVIATTPVTARVFDEALIRYADRHRRDVVLVRHGFHPEMLDPVRVDVALRTSFAGSILMPHLSLWRGSDGSLHLVPSRPDLFVAVAGHGLNVSLVAPWNTLDERADGLTRAAAEVVRAVRRARSG